VAIPREVPALGPHLVGDQGIYEVTPGGRIVWEWRAGDHLEEFGFTQSGFEYLRQSVARDPENIWGYLEITAPRRSDRTAGIAQTPIRCSSPTTS
jgi:hypothetical protein